MQLKLRKHQGFTLIEILVVLSISGLLMAIVGPLALERVDIYRAKTEVLDFKQKIRSSSNLAYSAGSKVRLEFNRHQLSVHHGTRRSTTDYEFIQATDLQIEFNRNGFPDIKNFSIQSRGRTEQIAVIELLGFKEGDLIYVE